MNPVFCRMASIIKMTDYFCMVLYLLCSGCSGSLTGCQAVIVRTLASKSAVPLLEINLCIIEAAGQKLRHLLRIDGTRIGTGTCIADR